MRCLTITLALTAAVALAAAPAHALLSTGDPALSFSKNQLVSGAAGPLLTNAEVAGKVKIIFVLGYN